MARDIASKMAQADVKASSAFEAIEFSPEALASGLSSVLGRVAWSVPL